MKFLALFISLILTAFSAIAMAAEDSLSVLEVKGNIAIVDAKSNSFKQNEFIYSLKSPYKFKIVNVEGNKLTVSLAKTSDLTVGETLTKSPSSQILKSLEAETRLKKALED